MHLAKFTFENNELRVMYEEDEPLFVASDLAKILGYRDAAHLTRMLDEDEVKGYKKVGTLGGEQQMVAITESGVYHAVFKSQRLEAKAVRRWVTGEVLPSIRRDGGYISPHATEEQLEHLRLQVDELMIEVAHLRKIDHDFIARELYAMSKSKGGSFWAKDYAKAAEERDSWKAVARGHEVQHQLVNLALEDVKEVVEHLLSNAKAGSKHRNDLAEVASRISTNLRKRDRILHDYTHGWGTCIPTNVQDFRLY